MPKFRALLLCRYCFLCCLCFLIFRPVYALECPSTTKGTSQEASAVATLLAYQKHCTPAQQIVHVLRVDPNRFEIRAVHAKGQALGLAPLSELAQAHGAIAGINGGFFKSGGELIDGLAAGLLKINQQWYGIAYRNRGAIGWSQQGKMTRVDRLRTRTRLYLNHHAYRVHSLNTASHARRSAVYTNVYPAPVIPTPHTEAFIIKNRQLAAIKSTGPLQVPTENDSAIYLRPAAQVSPADRNLGQAATLAIEVRPQFFKEHYLSWQHLDNIVSGGPLLIVNNQLIQDYTAEKISPTFIRERYARTAVGTLKNGHWLLAVVEQNAITQSPGMSIPELARFMKAQGCVYALNLDGGHSSTLYLNQQIMNHPSGVDDETAENTGYHAPSRPIADAILIIPK